MRSSLTFQWYQRQLHFEKVVFVFSGEDILPRYQPEAFIEVPESNAGGVLKVSLFADLVADDEMIFL
jgi:hypothetical protein